MSEYNACVNADLFAAVAPVSAMGFPQPSCSPSRPISMIAFNGTNDSSSYEGSQQSVHDWVARNGCTGDPTRESFGESYCDTWSSCSDGVTVKACSVAGMGHCWPGSDQNWPETSCPMFKDIDATAMSWSFLRGQRLKRAL